MRTKSKPKPKPTKATSTQKPKPHFHLFKKSQPWRIERKEKLNDEPSNVTTIHFDHVKGGWEQWVLLRTDVHHDNPHCDWKLERKHLEQAKERNSPIIDNGDLFCAMQGKFDKRSNKDSIRPEHQHGDYLDRLVETAADFYKPYADQFAILGRGNHETSVSSRWETCLTNRLAQTMKGYGSRVVTSGYGGWVRFAFRWNGTKTDTKNLYHYHGSGGGGPVTRGVIMTNRLAVYIPDADFVFTGHSHDDWLVPIARVRLSQQGDLWRDEQVHIRAAGYKNAWGDGYGGFEVERNHGPRPKSACWLRFYLLNDEIRSEVIRAT